MRLLTIFSFLIISCGALSAQLSQKEAKLLCLEVLEDMKHRIDSVIEANPDSFDFIGYGTIDTAEYKLSYSHLLNEKHNTDIYGMNFTLFPDNKEGKLKYFNHRWHYLRINLTWHWGWPGQKGFSFERQKMVMMEVRNSTKLISKTENKLIQPFLSKQNRNGEVLLGKKKLKLQLALNKQGRIEVAAKSSTVDFFKISNDFEFVYIVNDSVYNHHIPYGFMAGMVSGNANPFVSVELLNSDVLKVVSPPKNDSPGQVVRIMATFIRDSWVDNSKTIFDGPSVKHEVRDAWVGTVISNEITITQD